MGCWVEGGYEGEVVIMGHQVWKKGRKYHENGVVDGLAGCLG